MSKVYIITGPTACGKTDRAFEFCKEQTEVCEIINADSLQLYKDLPILTAYPTETQGISHHLFGILKPNETANVAWWYDLAVKTIHEVLEKGHIPVVVGGTGFYIKALLNGGLSKIPEIAEETQVRVRVLSHEALIEEVKSNDPAVLKVLHKNDTQRLQRALAVKLQTGQSILDFRESTNPEFEFDIEIILPERDELYTKINNRLLKMLEAGAVEEAKVLYQKYPNLQDLPIAKALGVREILCFIKGEIAKDKMIELIQTATRQYAKRQYTWFKNQL